MKKKLIVTTLSASLMFNVVGVPLLGLAATSAVAAALPSDEITDIIKKIYAKIPADKLGEVRAVRNEIKGWGSDLSGNKGLVSHTWGKIEAKKGSATGYDKVTQENVLKLILSLAFTYDENGSHLNDLVNDSELRAILDQLIKLSGSSGGLQDITFADADAFVAAVHTKFIGTLRSSDADLTKLLNLNVSQQLDTVINRSDLKFSKVVKNLGITGSDLVGDTLKFVAKEPKIIDTLMIFVKAYNAAFPASGGGSDSGSGNGSGSGTPPTTDNGIKEEKNGDVTTLTPDASKITDAFKGGTTYTIDASSKEGNVEIALSGSAILNALKTAPNGVIAIQFNGSTYNLPINVIDILDLAKQLGVDVKDLKITVDMVKVSGQTLTDLTNKATSAGFKLLGTPIEFKLTAESGSKKIDVTSFGNNYVARILKHNGKLNHETTTGLTYNPTTGEYQFVPTLFTVTGDTTTATMQRTGNSIYLLATNSKTFSDISGHWAQKDIELLASKLLIQGTSDTSYVPEGKVTRAEFSAMLVRALGLVDNAPASKFSDVAGSSWYTGSVGAAVKAGIIEGFEDGTFKPNASITREQMIVMMSRALAQVGKKPAGQANALSKFSDKQEISAWALEAAKQEVTAGLINGLTDTTLAPKDEVTRAQAAVVFKRLLQYAKFIN